MSKLEFWKAGCSLLNCDVHHPSYLPHLNENSHACIKTLAERKLCTHLPGACMLPRCYTSIFSLTSVQNRLRVGTSLPVPWTHSAQKTNKIFLVDTAFAGLMISMLVIKRDQSSKLRRMVFVTGPRCCPSQQSSHWVQKTQRLYRRLQKWW
jgi:hypothetical protein